MPSTAMNQKTDLWDPSQYMRFGNERLKPAIDLLAHVPISAPQTVVDLGCGVGNVSTLLKQRWPDADVLGIDGSESMLATARANAPTCRFMHADIGAWAPAQAFDLIYSNATLQWLGDHETLFARLLSLLRPNGCLAVQMPAMHDTPFRLEQVRLAQSPEFAQAFARVPERHSILAAGAYYDLLRPLVKALDIWETTYMHALTGEDAVVQWASGTSLRPYLDALQGEQRASFRAAYARALEPFYPRHNDGCTLLPFKRLFLVATV
jgi:trans-aconitate 2-methyltransferase